MAALAPNAWMNLLRVAQSKCVLNVAEGFFRRQLQTLMKHAAFIVASGDSEGDDDVILVSQMPSRR